VGERSLHTREVAGSKPAAPIIRKVRRCGPFVVKARFRCIGPVSVAVLVSAQWCPITALDESFQALAFGLVAPHRMGVDTQREGRVGVSELLHDGRRIDTADEEDRRERVAQLVGGDTLGQRLLSPSLEQLVGAAHHRPDDALAGVVLVAAGAG
jgi:hypothetical protein